MWYWMKPRNMECTKCLTLNGGLKQEMPSEIIIRLCLSQIVIIRIHGY